MESADAFVSGKLNELRQQLGYSTITVTLDTYSHELPDMRQTAAKAMREMLFKVSEKGRDISL